MDTAAISALRGMTQAQERLNGVSKRIASLGADPSGSNGDHVSLSDDAVTLIESTAEFKANLAVERTANELTQTVMRITR